MLKKLNIVQNLIQANKYKEASLEAAKYLNDFELGNTFASILADSLRKAEMYKELVDCYEKTWKEKKLVLGNWDTRHYAYALRKCDRYVDALKVCLELKEKQPNFKPILSEYYWNIFYARIKKWNIKEVNEDDIIPLAKEIKDCFEGDDNIKFSPFYLTMLYVSEFYHQKWNFEKCIEWILLLNPSDLGKDGKFRKGNEVITYEPHRAKYYKLYAESLISLEKNVEAKNIVISALNEYPFWLKMSEKLLSLTKKEFGAVGTIVFEKILSTIGFSDNPIRYRYLNALLGKNQEYAKNWENGFHELNDYERNFQTLMLSRVLKKLFNEIAVKSKVMTELPVFNYENISASELGDFVFCPASYSLQKTMLVQKDIESDIELSWSEKQMLIDRFETYRIDKGITSSFTPEELDRISILPQELEVILQSKILQESKKNKKPKIFFNQESKFSGVPDYWLENSVKYIIEEKFTRYSANKDDAQAEFPNHRAEILGQIIELKELNAKKGYIIYWLWDFEKVYYGEKVSTDYCLKGVKVYPIELSQQNIDFYNEKVKALRDFNESKSIDFDTTALIASKCVNCSVSQFCYHKTGNIKKIQLPYNTK